MSSALSNPTGEALHALLYLVMSEGGREREREREREGGGALMRAQSQLNGCRAFVLCTSVQSD